MLSKQQLQKFQDIWKKRFGEIIDEKEALEKGIKVLRLMELILKKQKYATKQQATTN